MQIALLVLPFIVVLGWILGHDQINLSFDGFQIAILFVAILPTLIRRFCLRISGSTSSRVLITGKDEEFGILVDANLTRPAMSTSFLPHLRVIQLFRWLELFTPAQPCDL